MKAVFAALTCAVLSSLAASRKVSPLRKPTLAMRHQDQQKIESVGFVGKKTAEADAREQKGKKNEAQAKGKKNEARAKGKKNKARAKGKKNKAQAKGKKNEAQAGDASDDWCFGNVFPRPDESFHIGHSSNVQVFDDDTLTELHEALNNDNDWEMDRVWEFKAKVTSAFGVSLPFGMPGGHGFLMFQVPAVASAAIVTAKGKVEAEADAVSIVYRGNSTNDMMQHNVTFWQVCLRQQPCTEFTGCLPAEKYKVDNSSNGDNMDDCCTEIYCKDHVECSPSTQWEDFADTESDRLGNSLDLCCSPKFCHDFESTVCTQDKMPKSGDGLLGSTAGECCEASFCRDFTGCPDSMLPLDLADGSPRQGASKEDCCITYKCDTFDCGDDDMWYLKDGAHDITGSTTEDCCDMLYCANYTCKEETKYIMKETPPVQGSTDGRCCEPILCSNHNCSVGQVSMTSPDTRMGSTDAECCEDALCMNYGCSDPAKWRKRSHYVQDGGLESPRKGSTDEECCIPQYCKNFECTSTKWKEKVWAADDTTFGWTVELCCDRLLCENHTCTTDWDGDGNGSKWYKKMDTNALKWQGSTDEECCYPFYCSQYNTKFPTKWKRKAATAGGSPLLGSSEAECFDPVYCGTFYSCDSKLGVQIIADASAVQGSTVDECCENITSTTIVQASSVIHTAIQPAPSPPA